MNIRISNTDNTFNISINNMSLGKLIALKHALENHDEVSMVGKDISIQFNKEFDRITNKVK